MGDFCETIGRMETTVSLEQNLSPEEADQLRRSMKKHKRNDLTYDNNMGDQMDAEGLTDAAWQKGSFAEMLRRAPQKPPLYTSEGEEDIMDDMGILDILQDQETVAKGEICPVVDIPWDRYKKTWQKWRRTLVVRTLGKSFSFNMLEPRIRRVWQLEYDCQLIDIDKGYIVARFYSQKDYLKVLTVGPCTILGHYLTITKWGPNFKPTDEVV